MRGAAARGGVDGERRREGDVRRRRAQRLELGATDDAIGDVRQHRDTLRRVDRVERQCSQRDERLVVAHVRVIARPHADAEDARAVSASPVAFVF